MDKVTRRNLGSNFQPGDLYLGQAKLYSGPPCGFTMVMRWRKNGLDYLGQIHVKKDPACFNLELFNHNYLSLFQGEKSEILGFLEIAVLSRVADNGQIPPEYSVLIHAFLEERIPPVEVIKKDAGWLRNATGFDLREIFDCLNAEYFSGRIQAEVMWGRDSKTRNRTAFRFGSYDRAKKLIRIHPRLDQDFVPLPVVELTVYHEMCHQWVPPIRRNGIWRDHHPGFKQKEREYCFYREARGWEKQNWKKFLQPVKNEPPEDRETLLREGFPGCGVIAEEV